MFSINQLQASFMIMEMWKVTNITNYPIRVEMQTMSTTGITTKVMTSEKFKYSKTPHTCIG